MDLDNNLCGDDGGGLLKANAHLMDGAAAARAIRSFIRAIVVVKL